MTFSRNRPSVSKILPTAFYARQTVLVAQELLGKYLVRELPNGIRAGRVIEVEAYVGQQDLACHASKGRTKRTEVLFGLPGRAYVYLIYGMYYCLNVVTERLDFPAAVLIRAIEDETGLIDGPGRVCRSYEIDLSLNYHELSTGQELWVEDRRERVRKSQIGAYPRINVDYAGDWAARPWRFRIPTVNATTRSTSGGRVR